MDNDETHPLDDPLGTIHSAAWLLEFIGSDMADRDYGERIQNIAKGLAIAYEQIQQYSLQEMRDEEELELQWPEPEIVKKGKAKITNRYVRPTYSIEDDNADA
jgi:light-regulated signal transduction histidine kinase (bacteriophytochrome)